MTKIPLGRDTDPEGLCFIDQVCREGYNERGRVLCGYEGLRLDEQHGARLTGFCPGARI